MVLGPAPQVLADLALLASVERQDGDLPGVSVAAWVSSGPPVEVSKLRDNRLCLALVRVELAVEPPTDVEPQGSMGVPCVAPVTLLGEVDRSVERLALVDVIVREGRDVAVHSMLRAQQHMPLIESAIGEPVGQRGPLPLPRVALEP